MHVEIGTLVVAMKVAIGAWLNNAGSSGPHSAILHERAVRQYVSCRQYIVICVCTASRSAWQIYNNTMDTMDTKREIVALRRIQ